VTYQTSNYKEQGGDNWVVRGTLTIGSGGKLIDEDGKWDDLRFPAATVRVPGSGGPGAVAIVGTIQTLGFDASSRETVYLQAQLPHNWKKGTAINPHVHWCSTQTTGGSAVWGIEYSVADIGGSFAAATTSVVTQTATTAHNMALLDSIDMSAYTGPSTMLLIALFRDSTAAADTLTTDAHLLEFDIHYKINSLGSSGAGSQGP